MPQEHYVLRCFSCETFQVHIVKKAKKWECKICGVKQSLKRNYGKGSGQDCRKQVMKLNELRLTNKDSQNQAMSELSESVTHVPNENLTEKRLSVEKPSISKWSVYLEPEKPDSEIETDLFSELLQEKKAFEYCKNETICAKLIKNETKCLSSIFSKQDDEYFFHKNKEKIQVTGSVELKNGSRACEYSMNTIEEQDKNYFIKNINKSSNIFESDLSDLDDLLNL